MIQYPWISQLPP